MKQKELYLPLIENFCENTKHYKGKISIPGLFIPHVLEKYDDSEIKYFYVGRDTNGWSSFNELIEYYENKKLEEYLQLNNEWPSVDEFIGYTNNSAGGFWTLSSRLHLKIKTGESNIPIRYDLDEKYKILLSDIGWGNLNSIETQQSLIKRNEWDNGNSEIYWEIKSKSDIFDKLKLILDIYHPDFLFIFNWQADEEKAFSGLNPIWIKDEYVPNLISTYTVSNYKTKIIWTVHPRALSFKGMNIEGLIQLIMERLY